MRLGAVAVGATNLFSATVWPLSVFGWAYSCHSNYCVSSHPTHSALSTFPFPLNHNSMNISHVRQVFVHTTIIRDILACTRTLTLQNLNLCSSVLTWCDRNLLTKMASYHFQVNLKFVLRYICIYTSNALQVIEPFLSAYMNFSGELP